MFHVAWLVGDPAVAGQQYHQDYYLKKPILYKYYRFNCGRDQYLQSIWGDAVPPPKDPYKEELRQ